jgi:hypothetical protein
MKQFVTARSRITRYLPAPKDVRKGIRWTLIIIALVLATSQTVRRLISGFISDEQKSPVRFEMSVKFESGLEPEKGNKPPLADIVVHQ